MISIKVAAPAKINLTLEIVNKRDDGFHNIKSIMQAISLYDYLTVTIQDSEKFAIELNGNSEKIPYDEKNLVYKAIISYCKAANIDNKKIFVYIEKNIPVEAGLAGGSTDAAATFFALNHLFDNLLSSDEIDELCASLGSDLNFCLYGGAAICCNRGEKIKKIPAFDFDLSLIKPKNLGISAKEAYTKYSLLSDAQKLFVDYTSKLAEGFDSKYLFNILEVAVFNDYPLLQEIKAKLPNSMMSGSGPTYFVLSKNLNVQFDNDAYDVIQGLKAIDNGVHIVC